jgi:inner membrane transporter RhtA
VDHRGELRVPAPLLVLASITSVQLGSAIARTGFDVAGAAGITLLRLGLSSLLLLAVLRPRFWRWPRASLASAGVLGLAMAAMNLTFYLAIRTVPLGVGVTVEFVGPLLLSLVQTRRLRDLLWALSAGLGVALLGLRAGGHVALTGLALALFAGLCWAGYILASARVGRLVSGLDGLAVSLAVAAVLVAPFGLVGAGHAVADPPTLLVGFTVALLSSVIPYGCELVALRHIATRVFGILMSMEPAAAAVAGLLVLDQHLGAVELVALGLVTIASIGVTLTNRPGRSVPAVPQPG